MRRLSLVLHGMLVPIFVMRCIMRVVHMLMHAFLLRGLTCLFSFLFTSLLADYHFVCYVIELVNYVNTLHIFPRRARFANNVNLLIDWPKDHHMHCLEED
jgi:hypothetical protein